MKKLMRTALVLPVLMAMTVPAMATEEMDTTRHNHRSMNLIDRIEHVVMDAKFEGGIVSRGEWQLVERNFPAAIEAFKTALREDPQDIRAMEGLINAYYIRGEYIDALNTVDRALALDPVNPRLHLAKGMILDAQGEYEESMDHYLTFTMLAPEDTGVLNVQRRVRELFNQVNDRLGELDRDYFTGLYLLSLERPTEAMPLLSRYVKEGAHRDHLLTARIGLGEAYRWLGKTDEAINVLQASAKRNPDSAILHFRLYDTFLQAGQFDQAKESWSDFVKYAPKSEAIELRSGDWTVRMDR